MAKTWDTAIPRQAPAIAFKAAFVGLGQEISNFFSEPDFSAYDNGDGTLTVTDAQQRFGTKPNGALPQWFFDFGAGSDQPHPTLSRNQYDLVWKPQCVISTNNVKAGSTHSMIIDTATADGSNSIFVGGDDELFLTPSNEKRYYRYWDAYNAFTETEIRDPANNPTGGINYKTQRWQHSSAQAGPYTSHALQASSRRMEFAGDSGDPYGSIMYDVSSWNTKKWTVTEEYHQTSSAAGVEDAVMYGVYDGQQRFIRDNVDSHKGYDPIDFQWDHYKLGNFRYWAEPGRCPWHANLLYVDDSWCRILITDKSTWVNTEYREQEIQVPIDWKTGNIKLAFRQGAFSDLAGKSLWVIDRDDNKIFIGSWGR